MTEPKPVSWRRGVMAVETRDRILTWAMVLTLAVALAVLVAGSSRADETPLGMRVVQAVVGDGAEPIGLCFASGYGSIAEPDRDELSRQVRKRGRNARLAQGMEAAPNARALAVRTNGELIGVEHGEAYILYVEDGTRRVDTFSRLESSEGDAVWISTGTTKRIPCGDD